jgi:O-antigen ligase
MRLEKIHILLLYLFVVLLHFEYWNAFGLVGNMTITKLVGYFYFLFTLRDIRRFYAIGSFGRFLWPLFLFFIILTVVSFFNYNVLFYNNMTIFDFSTFQCIILLWAISNHLHGQNKLIYITLLFFVLGAMLEGILYYLGIGVEMEQGRLKIFGDNENNIGFRMALAIIMLLSIVFENPLNFGKKRFFGLLGLLFLFPVLALSGSRTSLITLALGVLIFTFFMRMSNIWRKVGFILMACVGIVAMMLYFAQFNTLKQRFNDSIENGDTAGRIAIWHHVFPIFYESPVFGVGETGYAARIIPIYGEALPSHNLYIEILAYTGIIGLSLFLLLMARLAKKSWNLYKQLHFIMPVILIFMILVSMLASHGLYNKIFYYIYAIIIALHVNKKQIIIANKKSSRY